MKKYFAISILLLLFIFKSNGQTARGVKIGYIDMEYILENVPDYTEAKNQLEQKAQKWKQDIEAKKVEIAKLKDALKTERALLTKELIDEREEEIKFQETELLDFQQKRFGPNGDLMTQKAVLVKPIQDQVFTAVQDIAEAKKYDFIFDKSSDLTMLFAAKRHDVSDQVIRSITRAEKREQKSKKELKEQEKKEYLEDVEDENPALAARKKALEDKKAARDKMLEDRKLAMEAKKKEIEDKRKAAAEAREAKKTGTIPADKKLEDNKTPSKEENKSTEGGIVSPPKEPSSDNKTSEISDAQKTKEDKAAARAKLIEDKKKILEDRKRKILEDREAAKKAKEDKAKEPKTEEPKSE
ncbi:OmpH family outer membrane protein [Flavobacterium sp. RSB2_4_14]|uniref:OmpH family outer membrane protein n=1 Tax=Flavobacterium sp. RSB2_4_14 TaxID=3447665 RepID=UPI003F3ECE40